MPVRPRQHRPGWAPPPEVARLQRNREHDARRRTDQAWRAWYKSARWTAIRESQLRARPTCEACERKGVLEPATVCDHVTAHKGDPDLFWWGPFQSLCKRCHDRDKQREERAPRHDRD